MGCCACRCVCRCRVRFRIQDWGFGSLQYKYIVWMRRGWRWIPPTRELPLTSPAIFQHLSAALSFCRDIAQSQKAVSYTVQIKTSREREVFVVHDK